MNMNLGASEFLEDLKAQLYDIVCEYNNILDSIPPDQFKYDVTESVMGKLNGALYDIETMLDDVESGHYTTFLDGTNDEDEDNEDDSDFY